MTNFEHYLQYINRDKYPKLMKVVNKGIEAEENYDKERFNTAMMLCRQVIESIMKVIAEDKGIMFKHSTQNTTLMEMMNELVNKMGWGDYYKAKLHGTRMLGNDAIHDIDNDSPEEAFNAIKDVYTLFDLLFKLYYAPKHFQEKPFSLTNEESVTVLEKKEIFSESNELNLVYHPTQINTPVETVNHTEESKLNDNEQRWAWWLSLTPQQKEFLLVDVLQIKTFNMQYAEHREIMEANDYLNNLFELTEITLVDIQNQPIDFSLLNNFKNLEKLTMSHCKFDMMQLIQLKQLKSLDISRNNISDISPLVLLKDLQGLNLSHNQIRDISPLSKLQQLNDLDISNNEIVEIRNSWLWWLSLSHEWKMIFINKVLCLHNFNEHNLYNKKILEKDVESLFSLTEIDLSNCNLDNIDGVIGLKHLNNLNVSNNKIVDISVIDELKSLKEINISNNELLEVRNSWLWWLSLSHKWKMIFINKVLCLKNFDKCNLDNRELLERDVESLFSLTEIDLSNCNLNSIDGVIGLKHLNKLDISNNKISNINPLTKLGQLKELDVSNNKISNINPLEQLRNLEVLNIANNKISSLYGLYQLKKLKELDVSYNKVVYIPTILILSNLEVLYLNSNEILDITILAKLEKLKELDISNNKISNINVLYHLVDLTSLLLGGNPIPKTDLERLVNKRNRLGFVTKF